jgi:hypothetical protein
MLLLRPKVVAEEIIVFISGPIWSFQSGQKWSFHLPSKGRWKLIRSIKFNLSF